MQFPDARILIFAKAPVAGKVKTRLIPALGAQQAAAFHAACVRRCTLDRVAMGIAPVALFVDGPLDHPVIEQLRASVEIDVYPQQGDDLGERMLNAAQHVLSSASLVLLTGTDSPGLTRDDFICAMMALRQGHEVVMQPAFDGGYVMLGLQARFPNLFTDMPWGTDRVAQLTAERCQKFGASLYQLEPSWDVDRPEDLSRLQGLVGFETWASGG